MKFAFQPEDGAAPLSSACIAPEAHGCKWRKQIQAPTKETCGMAPMISEFRRTRVKPNYRLSEQDPYSQSVSQAADTWAGSSVEIPPCGDHIFVPERERIGRKLPLTISPTMQRDHLAINNGSRHADHMQDVFISPATGAYLPGKLPFPTTPCSPGSARSIDDLSEKLGLFRPAAKQNTNPALRHRRRAGRDHPQQCADGKRAP